MARRHSVRNTFGVAAAIQICQVHKGRNIIEQPAPTWHASVKKAPGAGRSTQTRPSGLATWSGVWSMRNRASGSILEGLEEILTVIRLGLPHELRRSLACTNIVENALGIGAP